MPDLTDHPEWYYSGANRLMRFLRFLNLLEEGTVKVSLTSLGMWASFIQTTYQMAFIHDLGAGGLSLAQNGVWLLAHTFRRKQLASGGR